VREHDTLPVWPWLIANSSERGSLCDASAMLDRGATATLAFADHASGVGSAAEALAAIRADETAIRTDETIDE